MRMSMQTELEDMKNRAIYLKQTGFTDEQSDALDTIIDALNDAMKLF